MYFTGEQTMQWFKSHLGDRPQTCIISGKTSIPLPLVLGVPQRSIWGPLFFFNYINDLPLSIQNSETDMCADDTTSGQVVTRVRVYNSHHKKVLTMQTVGSALTG